MEPHQCLNCGQLLNSKFCPDCGQKSNTHRITIKRFLAHDLLHGVWHLERGMLFTIKEAIVRPGQAALDYIRGKRIRYYNVFYLSLLLIGVNALLIYFIRPYQPIENNNPNENSLFKFLSEHAKLLVFAIVPVLAANAILVFRKIKLNFAEHLIVGGMCLIGIILSSIFWYLCDFGTQLLNSDLIAWSEVLFILILLLYPFWSYWNLTKTFYSLPGRLWRVSLFFILLLIELVLAFMLINYLVTGAPEFEILM